MSDEHRTRAEGEGAPDESEPGDATRYPGHENPEALRERSGLAGHDGRPTELSPEVDAGDEPEATT